MKFISTKGNSEAVTFSQAMLKGLAPDSGLYIPESLPKLPDDFIRQLSDKNFEEICLEISKLFIDEMDSQSLKGVIEQSVNFGAPLVRLTDNQYILELFHGPTLAFKDFGARFMAQLFGEFQRNQSENITILVATSGDTGSAVAQGFADVESVEVCLLYPSGKISHIQEQQLTTAGKNVTALEVDGTFDDCQKMVKQAFSDGALNKKMTLSSANSINIARLIPQSFYYIYAVAQLPDSIAPVFVVPSGNYGNLTAGLIAQKLGLPTQGFIAATNANDIVPAYLETGEFNPRSSIRTISNAMDVGNPSNFERLLSIFDHSHERMKQAIWGATFTDSETRRAIQNVNEKHDYLMDPHTAVGYLATQKYLQQSPGYFDEQDDTPFIILSTAHPAKFGDIIEPVIEKEVVIPDRLQICLDKQKESVKISNEYAELKSWLVNQ